MRATQAKAIRILITLSVIGIIAVVLLAIALPSFIKARNTSAQQACINNLRQIDAGKEQWARMEPEQSATVVESETLVVVAGGDEPPPPVLSGMAGVDAMSGAAFESLAKTYLEGRGYQVSNMRASNDYGVDLIANKGAERIAVQCKRSKNPISRKAISDAVAGMKYYKCTRAMVVTNNRFTEDAREFARGTDCELVDRTVLEQWLKPAESKTQSE